MVSEALVSSCIKAYFIWYVFSPKFFQLIQFIRQPIALFDAYKKTYGKTFLPFGNRIRRCIGVAFAQYEMKIMVAQILLHVKLTLKTNYKATLERKGVVLAPAGGLPVIVN